MVGYVPAVLQRPHHIRVELPRPLQRLAVPAVVRGDLALAYDLAGSGVDGGECVGALVPCPLRSRSSAWSLRWMR
jgi:hypothetical protein